MNAWVGRFSLRAQMLFLAGFFQVAMAAIITLAYVTSASANGFPMVPMGLGYAVAAALTLSLSYVLGRQAGARAETMAQAMQTMAAGDLSHEVRLKGRDEFSWMAYEYDQSRRAVAKLIGATGRIADELATAADQLSGTTRRASEGFGEQRAETDKVAESVANLATWAREVAELAASTENKAMETDRLAGESGRDVDGTLAAIESLSAEVHEAGKVIERLKEDSGNVWKIVDAIKEIAGQTNLLALNAAIEAARAGEHGRGFAVVADEVRTLASRTQGATQEIQATIQHMQEVIDQVSEVMERSRVAATGSSENAGATRSSVERIIAAATDIKAMNTRIAQASREQNEMAGRIDGSLRNIRQVADHCGTTSGKTVSASADVAAMASRLRESIQSFRV